MKYPIPKKFYPKQNLHINFDEDASEYSLKFDVLSFLGRNFFSRKPKLYNGYCNLGCGPHYIEGYCNTDFFMFSRLRRVLKKSKVFCDWELDLRYQLKCKDNFFKGILMEHTLEHLSVKHAKLLLAELLRVTRPKGLVRISVPDLAKYIDFYNGNLPHEKFYNWAELPAEAIWSLVHNFGHHSVYDFKLLEKMLKDIGFQNIRQCAFNKSKDPMLQIDHKGRKWESLYLEAMAP